MSLSLYTTAVGTYLQILPSVAGLLDKAEQHCRANGLADRALTEARLAEDMWSFATQVTACAFHSTGAVEGIRAGVFGANIDAGPLNDPPREFDPLRKSIESTIVRLKAIQPDEINDMIGRDMRFEFGSTQLDFTVEDFLLTFSLPNFYFHAATAYDILRSQGVAVGKMDYIGQMRLKG